MSMYVGIVVWSGGNLSRCEPILNVDLGRPTQCLVNNTVVFGQAKHGSQLLFARIGVEIELQSYLLETHRHIPGHSQGAAKVQVAFGADCCIAQPNTECGSDRVQRNTSTSDQCLKQHVARAGAETVATSSRMKPGFDRRLSCFYLAGNTLTKPSFGPECDQRGLRLLPVSLFQRRLQRP